MDNRENPAEDSENNSAPEKPRVIEIESKAVMSASSKLIAHKIPGSPESTEAVRISDDSGLEVRADESAEGAVDYDIKGKSPRGETNVVGNLPRSH